MAPLDDAFLRIDRAEKHLADLKAGVESYFESQPDAFVVRVEGMQAARPTMPTEPPPRSLGVVLGECIQNLRTGLDYLIYQLAWFDSGPPTKKRRTQFLIEDEPQGFKERKGTHLRDLSPTHVTMIERLQPYNGVKWLATLRDISNTDKHNVLEVIAGVQSSGLISVGLSEAEAIAIGGFRRSGDKMGMYYKLPSVVMLRDETPVFQTLELLISETRALLEAFQPEFKGWEIKRPLDRVTVKWGVAGPTWTPPRAKR